MPQEEHCCNCKSFDSFNDGPKKVLSQKGLTVEYVGEELDNLEAIMKGKIQLVYVSPESLMRNEKIKKMFLNSVYV